MVAMSGDTRETVTDWLTSADTCFLLGAGCSRCAGKPLIGELTDNVKQGADDALLKQFNNLKPTNSRPATVEDILTYLTRYRDILNTVSTTDEQPCTAEQIDSWLAYIKRGIVENIADDWSSNDYHKRFLERLRNPGKVRDIFSLNYDTTLEASLDDLRVPYADGFRGANRAWFDDDVFDEKNTVVYRLSSFMAPLTGFAAQMVIFAAFPIGPTTSPLSSILRSRNIFRRSMGFTKR